MQIRAVVLAAALALVPLAAQAADLVVWWEEGFNPEEDAAVGEIVAAFEHETSKRVEPAFFSQNDLPARTLAAVEAGHPPDFVFGLVVDRHYGQWAHEGRLTGLADALGSLASQFDQDALERATMLDATTGQ
jgi:multiple sugar transport system substrate-binding protein